MSRSAKSFMTLLTAVTLAAAAPPAFADDDPPADPPPACYLEDGTPVYEADECEDQGRQASGH